MKRTSAIAAVTAAALALSLAACGSADSAAASSAPAESTAASTEAASSEAPASEAAPAGDFDADQDITVISREDGSGTRGAFIELTGVEEKNADGKKVDNTTEAAAIQSSTNGVMTAVANDETAIGYISLGSLSNDVKAVTVGGVEASAETVKDGSYVSVPSVQHRHQRRRDGPRGRRFHRLCLEQGRPGHRYRQRLHR